MADFGETTTQGFSLDTVVRTRSRGNQRVGDLQPGDYLIDRNGIPVRVTGLSAPFEAQTATLKWVYPSAAETPSNRLNAEGQLVVSRDHPVLMRLNSVSVTICYVEIPNRRDRNNPYRYQHITWYSRCNDEGRETHDTTAIQALAAHEDVEALEDADVVVYIDDDDEEAPGDAVRMQRTQMPQSDTGSEYAPSQVARSDLPSSDIPSDPSAPPSDWSLGAIQRDPRHDEAPFPRLLAEIRGRMNWCDCNGIRAASVKVPAAGPNDLTALRLARFIKYVLDSNHFAYIDALQLRGCDEFILSAAEIKTCRHHSKVKQFAGVPYSFPAPKPGEQLPLPLDPHFLGLWLGDGNATRAQIIGSDDEIRRWLLSYVARLNAHPSRPAGAANLWLHPRLQARAGEVNPALTAMNGRPTSATHDIWSWTIRSRAPHYHHPSYWNPVLAALRELNLFDNKATGVPDMYKRASLRDRRELLAGLLESDGCYHGTFVNKYSFAQVGLGHRKIVYDFREIARSCGINCQHIFETVNGLGNPYYVTSLTGEALETLQEHIILPRKQQPDLGDRGFNLATSTQADATVTFQNAQSLVRSVIVEGGNFTLPCELIVHDSSL